MRGYTQGPAEMRVSSSPCCESVQTLLPPLFRWLAHASSICLPHRRHYTPATEYSRGPPHMLRAVPSMIDLDLAACIIRLP